MMVSVIDQEYPSYYQALLSGNIRACSETVKKLLQDEVDIRTIYEHLFQRSLYQVGHDWESGKVSVATEHLATATTEFLLSLVYPRVFSAEHIDRSAIVSCIANEFHQMGGRMVADIFELNGWHAYFLGADTPVSDLVAMVIEKQPDVLALSVSLESNRPHAERLIRELRANDVATPIILGGQAFSRTNAASYSASSKVRVIRTLAELEDFIATFPAGDNNAL